MKRYTSVLLLVVLLSTAASVYADRGSANRVATVTLGKRFDAGELGAIIDPAMAPLGLKRLSEREQYRAIGGPEMSWYGALGYVQGNASLYYEGTGGLSVLMFADRPLSCVHISVTDLTQAPEQRILPAINAIGAALSTRYGNAMKHYSDLQCLHAL